jgi:SAM-dependent methyltransferase
MSDSSSFHATDGDAYERQMGRWSSRLAELFLDFAGPAVGRCLDLGCGTGNLSAALLRLAPAVRVTGLDFSLTYVAHAEARPDTAGAEFQVGDACALPFADGSFDPTRWRRSGASPGRAAWRRPRFGTRAAGWRLFFDTAAMMDQAADALRSLNFVRPMTRPGELAAAWDVAGFADVTEALLTIRMEFADFDDFWSPYLGGQGPVAAYVVELDPVARERLRDHLRRAYLDGEADGPRSYGTSAWAVRGVAPDLERAPVSGQPLGGAEGSPA